MKQILLGILVVCLFFGFCTACFATEKKDPSNPTMPVSVGNGEEYLNMIPKGAYITDAKITFDNLPYYQLLRNYQDIFLDKLFDLGILTNRTPAFTTEPEKDSSLERVSQAKVKEVFELCFGPGSFSKLENTKSFSGTGYVLGLLDGENDYIYYKFDMGGDPSCSIRNTVLSAESDGESLIVKTRFGIILRGEDPSILYSDIKFWLGQGESSCMAMIPQEKNDAFRNGEYDEYLPVYTHTFKFNEDGSYYWYSTEMTEGPKTIPENMVHSYPKNTDDGTETTAPLTEVTDGTDDTTVIPSNGDETGDSALWIYVAAGLGVALVIALGVFFAVKKKKA